MECILVALEADASEPPEVPRCRLQGLHVQCLRSMPHASLHVSFVKAYLGESALGACIASVREFHASSYSAVLLVVCQGGEHVRSLALLLDALLAPSPHGEAFASAGST